MQAIKFSKVGQPLLPVHMPPLSRSVRLWRYFRRLIRKRAATVELKQATATHEMAVRALNAHYEKLMTEKTDRYMSDMEEWESKVQNLEIKIASRDNRIQELLAQWDQVNQRDIPMLKHQIDVLEAHVECLSKLQEKTITAIEADIACNNKKVIEAELAEHYQNLTRQ